MDGFAERLQAIVYCGEWLAQNIAANVEYQRSLGLSVDSRSVLIETVCLMVGAGPQMVVAIGDLIREAIPLAGDTIRTDPAETPEQDDTAIQTSETLHVEEVERE